MATKFLIAVLLTNYNILVDTFLAYNLALSQKGLHDNVSESQVTGYFMFGVAHLGKQPS